MKHDLELVFDDLYPDQNVKERKLDSVIDIITNDAWNKCVKPTFSIQTTCYNRKREIHRNINSIEKQKYRNFEHVIVDNGSTDDLDDVVLPYLENTDIPVIYIKKKYGGAHTGRNCCRVYSRGLFSVPLDSDDELVEDGLQIFYDAWCNIPDKKKREYGRVIACVQDHHGNRAGGWFPENINNLSKKDEYLEYRKINANAEHFQCDLTVYVQDNLSPEPQGICFVSDNVVNEKLNKKYRIWILNDIVRIYWTDDHDTLTKETQQRNKQYCLDSYFLSVYVLNHWHEYPYFAIDYIKYSAMCVVFKRILKKMGDTMHYNWHLKGLFNHMVQFLLWLPSIVEARLYMKKYGIKS